MTPKKKGPTRRKPARLRGSTEQESAAACVRDECREQLRRIAEDAQNFRVRLFFASDDSAVEEWRVFPERKSEWVRNAAESLRAYVQAIRKIWPDKHAMAMRINKDWPHFRVYLDKLFATIRDIYDRAAQGANSDDDGEEGSGSGQLERAIRFFMAQCELQIMRAVTGPFKMSEPNPVDDSRAPSAPPSELPRKITRMSQYAPRIAAANLTELQHQVLLLHIERGMSFRSIATHLHKDASTIREHYKAALEKLGGEHER
jgi:hypothetical protein